MPRLALVLITAITLTVLGAPTFAQQPASLAERLSALRDGWDYGSAPSKPIPPTKPATKAEAPQAAPEPSRAESLPAQSTPPAPVRDGSARARMLRELRSGSLTTSRPSARAGSVLSQGVEEPTGQEPVYTSDRNSAARAKLNGKVSREIAAEVASTMDSTDSQSSVSKTPARGDGFQPRGTSVSVAQRNTTERVPLFIGGGYSKKSSTAKKTEPAHEDEAGVDAAEPSLADSATEAAQIDPFAEREQAIAPVFEKRREEVAISTPAPPITPIVESVSNSHTDELLISQKMPVIVSRVLGPRSIVVGREATYRVEVANRGDADAESLDTQIAIPEWAEVVGAEATAGGAARGDAGAVNWRMPRLIAGESARLDLKLIARQGRPIELGVTWKHSPVDTMAMVEVKEPKLELDLVGPGDVLYGKPQLYRLTITNPGTGDAENVVLKLTPPGAKPGEGKTHPLGVLTPGASRSLDIELTAREAGKLSIEAAALAEGGVRADAMKEVFCRKAELEVDWRGPKERYSGAQTVHYFRVRNPGTAAAHEVELTVELPEGFAIISKEAAGADGRVSFRVGSLQPGDDRYFELKGVHHQAGDNRLKIAASGEDNLSSEEFVATTNVVAIADLKLDVLDPKGPVATGQEVAYQIRVTNRGASEAREVRVVGLFSAGIEPYHVEGGLSKIHDGRVAFETIESVPAGEEQVFTIYARAHEEGTHLFRAEVLCRDLDIKLAAEETTRFFRDETLNVAGDPMSSGRSGAESVFPR